MSLIIEPKYVMCKIDKDEFFKIISETVNNYSDCFRFSPEEFELVFNEELGLCEVEYRNRNCNSRDSQENIMKCKVMEKTFNSIEGIELTNGILRSIFNIQEGQACIQYHDDYFDMDKYYYISMPYECFQKLA